MKKKFILFALALIPCLSQAQLIDENFDEGIPADWTQMTDVDVAWTTIPDMGVGGSDCAVADYTPSSEMGISSLETNLLDLTGLIDPRIVFSAAIVRNIFVAPQVSLWYDIGDGWEYLANWGDEFWEDPDNIIPVSNNLEADLIFENLNWATDLTYDLSALGDNSAIRFALQADFVNGGWVLLDDVKVQGETGSGINEEIGQQEISVYPNPTQGLLNIETQDQAIEQVVIYDLLGQKVYEQLFTANTVAINTMDLTSLGKGTYCVVLNTANQERYQNLVTVE